MTNYLARTLKIKEWQLGDYEDYKKWDKYKDPDTHCKDLYGDLNLVFQELAKYREPEKESGLPGFSDFNLEEQPKNGSCELKESSGLRYGSDYIGPSRKWAEKALSCQEIGEFLIWSRRIGGHMLWPRRQYTSINMKRGGNGLFDRMDLALLELQDYMRDPEAPAVCKQGLRDAYITDEEWLDRFKPSKFSPKEWFKTFIDFWKLESFVNEDGDPMSMVCNSPDAIRYQTGGAVSAKKEAGNKKCLLKNYGTYVENLKVAIEARTNTLENILDKAKAEK